MTTAPSLSCPKCRAELTEDLAPPGNPRACRSCNSLVEGLVFPALHRRPTAGKAAEALVAVEDAGCFFHPQSRAQVPCDSCGRFLCALCDIELKGKHICPSCLNNGKQKSRTQDLNQSRVLYGGIALMIAFFPILAFWPFTIVTAPLALFIAIYGWRKPASLTAKGRSSYVIAILLSLLQIAAWVLAITGIFNL